MSRRPTRSFAAKDPLDLVKATRQPIDFGQRVVEVKAGPGAGLNAQPLVQRHGAVVAGADRDAVAIEQLGNVVGVNLARA